MSEFLAEASVLVRPNTAGFRAALEEQLAAATAKPLTIPVVPVAVTGIQAATTAQAELTAVTATTTTALESETVAARAAGTAAAVSASEFAIQAKTLGQVEKAALASAASMAGLRGAVLAASLPFLAATVGFVAFGKSLKLFSDFERELNIFQATAEASAEQMRQVGDAAKQLGSDASLPAVSAKDAAEAMTELSKAGLSVTDSVEGARGVLELAGVAGLQVADSANIAASALNAFGLAGDQAVHVADLLAASANAAQGSAGDMGDALTDVSSTARLLGLSLESTVTLLTLLAKSGEQGARAGAILRVALLRLVAPSKQAREVLDSLNIKILDVNGNLRPEIFREFAEATADLAPSVRNADAAIVFGTRGIRALGILSRTTTEELRNQQKALDQLGEAQRLNAARARGLGGDTEALTSNLETLGITIGQVTSPVVRSLVRGFDDLAGGANFLAGAIERLTNPVDQSTTSISELQDRLRDAQKDLDRFRSSSDSSVPPALTQKIKDLSTEIRTNLHNSLTEAHVDAGILAHSFDQAADAATNFKAAVDSLSKVRVARGRVAGLQEQALDIDIAGDNPQQQLANLKKQEAEQRKVVTGLAAHTESRRKAKEELDSIIQQERSLESQIASDAESAASDIQRAREDADRAIIDALGAGRDRAQTRILVAQGTTALADDIQANQALRRIILSQIAQVKETVKNAKTKAAALRDLTRALIQTAQEIKSLQAQQAQAVKDALQERRDRLREGLDLNLQIAQATGNKAAQARALNAQISEIEREIRQTRKGSLERKRLILELRQAQASLRDLKNERKKTAQAAKDAQNAAEFAFLQTQTGFVSNLLGNLIPGSATAGLVGGAPTSPTPATRPQPSLSAKAAGPSGPSSGQASEQIALLRAINAGIKLLNQGQDHPEAKRQRRVGSAIMDTAGNTHGM